MERNFTKQSLKNRMVVLQRNNRYGIVIDNYLFGVNQSTDINKYYNDDLTSKIGKDYDIITVYRCIETLYPFLFAEIPKIKDLYFSTFPMQNLYVFWERNETQREVPAIIEAEGESRFDNEGV